MNRGFTFALTISMLAAQEPQPVIRIGTRLVQINVVAHDKNGPVADLKKDDFTLTDKGKPREIAVFRMDSRHADDEKSKAAPRLPPNVFSNSQADASNATVILFDGLNTTLSDQQYAKRQIVKFLNDLGPDDRVAIYILGRRLWVLHEFTTDMKGLRDSIRKFAGESSGKGDSPVNAGTDVTAVLGQFGGVDQVGANALRDLLNTGSDRATSDAAALDRVRITTDAMKAIARHLERVPGRKNLVWVSAAFPIAIGFDVYGALATEKADEAARALMEANVAVYPVDPRGVMVDPKWGSRAASSGGNPMPAGRPPVAATAAAGPTGWSEQNTMDRIAGTTGGRSFYNTNDIMGSVRKALEDSDVSYTLGFYLSPDEMDSKFHEIKVSVNRKGVELRTRKGYIALKDEPVSAMTKAKHDQMIREALAAPLDSTGLTLSFRLDRINSETLQMLASIEGSRLVFEQKDGKYNCVTQLVIAQQAADGGILEVMDQTVNWSLTPQRYRDVQARGLQFKRVLATKPGAASVMLVVLDHASSQLGSVRGQITRNP